MFKKDFWVTNICNMNVSLADLNLTIKAFSSVNLLDKKHYYYTLEQLEKSEKFGSIFKKSNKIKVRQIAPQTIKMNVPFIHETYMPTRGRSVFSITEDKYEELNMTDEQFAEENAETAELDTKPLIIKG